MADNPKSKGKREPFYPMLPMIPDTPENIARGRLVQGVCVLCDTIPFSFGRHRGRENASGEHEIRAPA